MKATLLLGAALACGFAAVTPVLADEQPPPPPPADYGAPSSGGSGMWDGWYIGGHLGGAFRDDSLEFRDFSAQQNLSFSRRDEGDGWTGGVHGGYGWMSGHLYLGAEADMSWATGTDYVSSIRGRAGFGNDQWLVYGTAGAAFTGTDDSFRVISADDGTERFTRDRDDTGFVGGGGIEYALNQNLSLGAEALWYDFGGERDNLTTSWGDDFSVRDDSNFGVVRARLTYYLNN